jgi:hypothetical protein
MAKSRQLSPQSIIRRRSRLHFPELSQRLLEKMAFPMQNLLPFLGAWILSGPFSVLWEQWKFISVGSTHYLALRWDLSSSQQADSLDLALITYGKWKCMFHFSASVLPFRNLKRNWASTNLQQLKTGNSHT